MNKERILYGFYLALKMQLRKEKKITIEYELIRFDHPEATESIGFMGSVIKINDSLENLCYAPTKDLFCYFGETVNGIPFDLTFFMLNERLISSFPTVLLEVIRRVGQNRKTETINLDTNDLINNFFSEN